MSKIPEKQIAVEAVKVVEEFGEISMTELIEELIRRMQPDGHDMEIIANRNDTYFSQKVRNLRSHNNSVFFANVHFSEERNLYISNECNEIRDEVGEKEYAQVIRNKKEKTRAFYARKADFDKINRERKLIGDKGELCVLEDQKAKVKKAAPDCVDLIRHVSKLDGDGAGYDIQSFDEERNVTYIEVKSTLGDKTAPFYMSKTEFDFYEMHRDKYIIARVYNLNIDTGYYDVDYIKGSDFEANFEKEISAYKVRFKR